MRLIIPIIALLLSGCAPDQPLPPPAVLSGEPSSLLDDVRILSADDMEGRLVGTPGNAKARAYILGRLNAIGLEPLFGSGFEQRFVAKSRSGDREGVNLLARIPGTSGSAHKLVVMAHYDHVGVRSGQIYNGADDNASGVAALLAIAESFKRAPPAHDVILAVVDAEEGGLQGARNMVKDARFAALLPSIALAVNFDMISRGDKGELYVAGAHHFPWLKPRLEAVAATAPVRLLLGHDSASWGPSNDWTMESDHGAFHEVKVPWVYFGVEDHPDYHQPTDDFDAIPKEFFRAAAATTEMAVRAFDRDLAAIALASGR